MSSTESPPLTVEQALQQAVALHREGQLQAAADLYSAILRSQPGHPDANQNLGVIALQSGQAAASLPYFKTALENRPSSGEHWLSYINALILTNQLETARSVIAQGRQHGLQGEALELLSARAGGVPTLATAVAWREAGDYSQAIAATRAWLHQNADDAAAHALLAQLLLTDKQDAEAAAALNAALALNPSLPAVQRNRARLLLKQQQLAEALQAAQLAYQGDSSDPENQAMLAAMLIAHNQLDQAEPLLASALHSRPRYAEALVNRAQLKMRRGDVASALGDTQQALAIKPHMVSFWLLAISLYSQLNDNPGLAVALERYLALEPGDVSRTLSLGVLKRLENKPDEAIALFTRATTLAPANAAAWSNLAMTLHEEKRTEQAKIAYLRALDANPALPDVNHNLGAMALAEGRHSDAQRHFHAAITSKPDLGGSYLNLGHTLADLQQLSAALDAYRQASELNSADGSGPSAALSMAILYYIGGDLDQCAKYLVASRPLMDTSDEANNSDRNYWGYLARLVSWHQHHPTAADPVAEAQTLYVVGESHSLATHRMPLRYRGRTMQCSAQWVPGAKQWHIGSGKHTRANSRFAMVLNALAPASTVLLLIGEIDCRHDEGMLVAWKKRPEKSLQSLMEATIDGYINHLKTVREHHGHQLIIAGVPASNAKISELPAAEQHRFVQLIRAFNHYLRQQALSAGMDFLDVHTLTDRGDGISNGRWHLDPIHLLPSATAEAFERHLMDGRSASTRR